MSRVLTGRWVEPAAGKISGQTIQVRVLESRSGRQLVDGIVLTRHDGPIRADDLRQIPLGAIEAEINAGCPRPTPAETVRLNPKQFARRIDFIKEFANQYALWAATTPRPAAAIADSLEISRSTVHSWVREARLRGMLHEPTSRRKADQ